MRLGSIPSSPKIESICVEEQAYLGLRPRRIRPERTNTGSPKENLVRGKHVDWVSARWIILGLIIPRLLRLNKKNRIEASSPKLFLW
jgi:hypothetical protein